MCLAKSSIETNKDVPLKNRNWNWKDENFRYSEARAKAQPGYIGSYAMDAMAMTLHCVWTTSSFTEAMLKCANTRGDSDSVCSVTGQIVGAVYGLKKIPRDWIKAVIKWDPNYYIPLRAYKLYKQHPVNFKENENENGNSPVNFKENENENENGNGNEMAIDQVSIPEGNDKVVNDQQQRVEDISSVGNSS